MLGEYFGQGQRGAIGDQLLGEQVQADFVRVGAGGLHAMCEVSDASAAATAHQARAASRTGAAASQAGGNVLGTHEATIRGYAVGEE
jgi:hypothetical protein